jgi:hypothetical protein
MRLKTSQRGFIQCEGCKAIAPRTGPTQKYCVACSSERDRARKNKWAAANPPTPAKSREYGQRSKESAKQAGAIISQQHAETISWDASENPELVWLARTSVPFSWRGSKNAIWSTNSHGHVYARREATEVRRAITHAIAYVIKGQRVAHNKLWIDLLVQKTNHKGDAVNFVDLVCDGIKDALDLDDRWYAIRRLDWQIVKIDPRIFIGIGQESDEDMNACSACGRIQPLTAYGKKSGTRLGVERTCKECRSEGRKLRRATFSTTDAWREIL